jgi:hypothetical protein
MATWIEDVMEATADLESPRKYWLWSGISTISAVIRRNVWIERYSAISGMMRLIPNLYVFLVGPSGIRKGPPVDLAKLLLNEVGDIQIISGRNSVEAIIQELGHARTAPGRRGPKTDSTAIIISREFSTSLVRNQDALTLFTDLYDSPDEWKNTMKHTGVDRLKDVCISILGAMNETHFGDIISEKEITGGFIGRCHIVFSRERARKNSLMHKPAKMFTISQLAEHLKKLKELSGPATLTEEATKFYDDWYEEFNPEGSSDKTGSALRVSDNVLKVALIFALSREPVLIIQKSDVETALRVCLESTARVETVTRGVGQSEMAVKQKSFLNAILSSKNYMIGREKLLQKCHGDFDVHDLNRMEETFVAAGIIKEGRNEKIDGKKDYIYELSERTIEEYAK